MERKLCIIPARGGSKRIPKKNIRTFCGKPIIEWVIEAAKKSRCFNKTGNFIVVSTDDQEIAEISHNAGAIVFWRSPENASDTAVLSDVIHEVLKNYRKNPFKYLCCLLPTAALVNAAEIQTTLKILKNNPDVDQVLPVVKFGYPIQRALRRDEGYKVSLMQPEHMNSLSQNLEPAYHDAGQFYWMRTHAFMREQTILLKYALGYELPETEVQDIDHEEDWRLAKIKFRAMERTYQSPQFHKPVNTLKPPCDVNPIEAPEPDLI